MLFSRRLRRGMQRCCIISQRKTVWVDGEVHSVIVVFVVIAVLGFVCDYQRETFGASSVQIDRVLLCDYSLADHADDAEECSRLHYFAEKDRLSWLWGSFCYSCFCCYCCFGFCLRLSAGDIWGFICADRLSTLM